MREMAAAAREENRIFVGGLASDVTERQLEHAFSRFGKILDSQIMLERDSGRHRGFGFLTFADRRGMEDAIRGMHGREFGDRVITVNRAEPKNGSDSLDHGYRGGYSSGGRGRYGKGDRSSGNEGCFNCGLPDHWARECPSAGGRGGNGGLRSRLGEADGRRSRFGGERDREVAERFGGGRYGDKNHYLDDTYGGRGTHDRYVDDRYPPGRDPYTSDRYGGSDRYPQTGFGKDKGYDRDNGSRGGSRYGNGGPTREGRSYRDRLGPYDRPSRGGGPSSYDRF